MDALPPEPPRTRDTRRRDRWIITIVATALIALLVILATVSVPQTSSFDFRSGTAGTGPVFFNDRTAESLCPSGATASVSYSSSGLNLTISIVAPNGTAIWTEKSPDGSTTFAVPTCGTYQFVLTGSGDGTYSVDGTLSYSAPIL